MSGREGWPEWPGVHSELLKVVHSYLLKLVHSDLRKSVHCYLPITEDFEEDLKLLFKLG